MGVIFTKSYDKQFKLQEIQINEFPLVIITDTHTNIANIRKLKEQYPNNQFICLGDITFLFAKEGEEYNKHSIQYFIDSGIPCLEGNHDSHVLSCSIGDSFSKGSSLTDGDIYDLSQQHIDYLKSLPRGFKLLLPDGKYYLCFHNTPNDLWSHYDYLNANEFQDKYPISDDKLIGVIQGHLHKNFIHEYKDINSKRISVGQLCNSNHHTNVNNGGNYALLTENGIEFKKI